MDQNKTSQEQLLEAVNAGIDECIQNGILKDILEKNREEVVSVLLSEFNMEMRLKTEKEKSYKEGFQDGADQEKNNTLLEIQREDYEKARRTAAELRENSARQEICRLQEEIRRLRSELAETRT